MKQINLTDGEFEFLKDVIDDALIYNRDRAYVDPPFYKDRIKDIEKLLTDMETKRVKE